MTFTPAAVRADRAVLWRAHPAAYPLVRALARGGPALRVPGLGVVVSAPDLVREVLTDADTYRKDGPGSPGELWTPVVGPRALTNMDGADHRRLRTTLAPMFGARPAAELVAGSASAPLAELGRRLGSGEAVDVAMAAREVVAAVVCGLLGVPGEAHGDLARRGEQLLSAVRLRTRRLSAVQVGQARSVLAEVVEPAAAAWRQQRTDCLPGAMRRAGLDEGTTRSLAGVLFLTGTETVTSYLPRLVALLADSGRLTPRHAAATAADREHWCDEALRVSVPTPLTLRRAAVASRIGAARVAADDRVLVATVNACRDRGMTTEALRGLWFGAGPHFCLGRAIAMAQARALLTVLTEVASEHALSVVHRRVRRGTLIAAYDQLVLRADR